MIFIPGFLIALLTFPGVIVHETAHLLFCRWQRVPVLEVCYFRLGNPSGYVVHAEPREFRKSFFISMGPFFLNSILCVLFCSAAFAPIWVLKVNDPFAYLFGWLGLSMGMHAFPSTTDLGHIWHQAPAEVKKFNILAIGSYPFVVLLYVLNFARFFWADLIYGVAIGFLGPLAILRLIA